MAAGFIQNKRDAPVPVDADEAFRTCAAEMPDGWTMHIEIERNVPPDPNVEPLGTRLLHQLQKIKEAANASR